MQEQPRRQERQELHRHPHQHHQYQYQSSQDEQGQASSPPEESLLGAIGGAGSENPAAGAALDDDVDEGGGTSLGNAVDPAALQAQLGGEGLDAALDGDANGGAAEGASPQPPNPASARGTKLKSWIDSASYGKFIGITTFFNPGRHQNKVDNFRKFRDSVAAQGLQMLCVELVFGDDTVPFQLLSRDEMQAEYPNGGGDDRVSLVDGDGESLEHSRRVPDCDILVRRRTSSGNTLWQKERLLNIALEHLPRTVDKVMWLDSDLIFLNEDWVVETSELLDRFPVVQPFGWMTYLSSAQEGTDAVDQLATLPLGQGVGLIYHSAGLGLQSFPDMCFRSNFLLGHPGFAWAARREVITASGFYDRSIIGGGDRIMLNGFTGHYVGVSRKMPLAMAEDVRAFGRKLTPLVGPTNVSYTPGVVLHIWHGNRADRDYTHRYQILLVNKYDPVHDVRVNEDGVLAWNSEKPKLHRMVNEYFNNRKEGPKANKTTGVHGDEGGDDVWSAQRKSLSRPVRSFLGYHCGRPDYRASCKVAFRLWGDSLRATQLQVLNKRLREQQAQAQAALAASAAQVQKRTRGKLKAKRERKQKREQQHEKQLPQSEDDTF